MQFLDDRGCVVKTREVVEHLHHLVLSEPAITSVALEIEPAPQPWGQSALHFSVRLIGSGEPALLKVNVARDQLWWTRSLAQAYPELLPRVFTAGEHVGGESLGWILWERVRNGLHPGWAGREFDMILEAGVKFQVASRTLASSAQAAGVLAELRVEDLAERLEQGVRRAAPGPADRVLQRVFEHWAWVNDICETEVCHGDLHMANALCRDDPPDGEALLIDHHPTRMPWACEPAKPEILNAEPTRTGCRTLVARQATIRSRLGLSAPTGAELERLQAIVLGWWAIQMWAYIGPSPDPNWRARRVWHAENGAYVSAAAAA
jgi:hypothetical protein